MTFPTTQTETVSKLGPDTNPEPFAVNASEVTWKVVVTPRDPYGTGISTVTTARVLLTRGCEPFPRGYVLVDCDGEFVFTAKLTEAVTVSPAARVLAMQNVIAQHILGADGTPGHSRFRNFTDLLMKRTFLKEPAQSIPYDSDTYEYVGNPAQMPVFQFIDRDCFDVPLVGPSCLHGFLFDVDNEPGFQMMDFGPVAASIGNYATIVTQASPAENGTVSVRGLDDDSFEVTIDLRAGQLDLLFEPPVDAMLHDIDPGSEGYMPHLDLSTYLKGYGRAELGDHAFVLTFHVDVPSTFDRLNFSLRTFHMGDHDFQFVFSKGPYCNNNLGTTEGPLAGLTYRSNPSERPFDTFGVPLFAGLVSDTVSGSPGDAPLVEYTAVDNWPYPHVASNPHGGSGVGRDRIGVNSVAYAFDLAQGMFSDNPNNCARPADACTVPGVQDGGVRWKGVSASCEYPNISNNSDDATYAISEQITSIIPYIQGIIKISANHLGNR